MAKKNKAAKKQEGMEEEWKEEQGDSLGSKIAMVIVTLLIIVIWLGIIALLIKTDVGGFGSSVLTPALKDVPVLNKILPGAQEETNSEEVDTEHMYDSIEEAVEQIKALELQIDDLNEKTKKSRSESESLKKQVEELSKYKENQAKFEEEKQKYYEEVVLSDEAPDINEYKTFYEQIEPENAEVLYKQVVEQLMYDDKVEEYTKTYSSMKAKEAAAIFDTMTDNLGLVADILMNMDSQARADILGKMDAQTAAKLTEIMEPDETSN